MKYVSLEDVNAEDLRTRTRLITFVEEHMPDYTEKRVRGFILVINHQYFSFQLVTQK